MPKSKHHPTSSAQKPQNARGGMLHFAVTFAIVYLVATLAIRIVFPNKFANNAKEQPQSVVLVPQKKTLTMGRNFFVSARNQTGSGITLSDRCPEPPLIIERKIKDKLYQLDLAEPVTRCDPVTGLPPGSSTKIDLSPWKYEAFHEPGVYRISLPINNRTAGNEKQKSIVETEILVREPGIFVSAFRAFISKPLLNGMILIASLLPGHSLGWSIIIVTLAVKLFLFLPSKQAFESQKKLQAIQPKLDAIKKKHAGNQQKITEETMAVWKSEKINPMKSCLPTILQLPVLLGLFYIIRDSSSIELARHLLYPPFLSLDWTFSTDFLGVLDLTMVPFKNVDSWFPPRPLTGLVGGLALPAIIAITQFAQMKMTMAKKTAKSGHVKKRKTLEEHLSMQNMMIYMLPVMLIFVSGSLPAAVSIYWGASTLFSIGQQYFINKGR